MLNGERNLMLNVSTDPENKKKNLMITHNFDRKKAISIMFYYNQNKEPLLRRRCQNKYFLTKLA